MRDANISPGIRDENSSPYMCEVGMRDNNMSPDMRDYNRSPYFCDMGMRDDMCICVYRSMSMCAYMYIDCGIFYHMYMRDRSFLFSKAVTNTKYCNHCAKNTIENQYSRCNFYYKTLAD